MPHPPCLSDGVLNDAIEDIRMGVSDFLLAFPELPTFSMDASRRWEGDARPLVAQCNFLPVLFGQLIHVHVKTRKS